MWIQGGTQTQTSERSCLVLERKTTVSVSVIKSKLLAVKAPKTDFTSYAVLVNPRAIKQFAVLPQTEALVRSPVFYTDEISKADSYRELR